MKVIQNPFSIYDFLGYMVPGIFFVLGIYCISIFPFEIQHLNIENINLYGNYFVIILLSYLLGHILSFISSVSIEKYSIWTLGYPSKYLFNKKPLSFIESITSKYDSEHKITSVLRVFFRICIKSFIYLLLLPISIIDNLIRHLFRLHDQYARSLDPGLLALLRDKLNTFLLEKYNIKDKYDDSGDYFRIVYHHALENAPNHTYKLQNYVSLYGFLRTTTFIFIILFWYSLYMTVSNFIFKEFWFLPIFLGIISFILYLSFNKFYRKFSLEAFMATTISIPAPNSNKEKSKEKVDKT